jgi:hypothetical protein
MKKLLLTLIAFVLITTPVLAAKPQAGDPSTCDPNAEWKNHGEYVSCVAKLHLGGKVTSQAANSTVGKILTPTSSPSATPTPTIDPSITPTVTPEVTPTEIPTMTPTPTLEPVGGTTEPDTQNLAIQNTNSSQISEIIEVLNNILTSLSNLI